VPLFLRYPNFLIAQFKLSGRKPADRLNQLDLCKRLDRTQAYEL